MRVFLVLLAIFALATQGVWRGGHTENSTLIQTAEKENLEFFGERDDLATIEKLPEDEIEEILVDEDGPDYMGFVEDDEAVEFAGDDTEFLAEETMDKFEELNERFKR
mmetsp:Transcript_32070/g.56302  ORF Transcript_32070/g.56302 Transcript_32070/m.56302 type:complete len:108 (+) Transcript_32070:54-377(+)